MFTLTIKTGNAAFGEGDYERDREIARILRAAAKTLEDGNGGVTVHNLRDSNGNHVGKFHIL